MDVLSFDEVVTAELKTIPGIQVFDGKVPDEIDPKPANYLVLDRNDIIPGEPAKHTPITGFADSSVFHPFGVLIVASSPDSRNNLIAAVRRRLFNLRVEGCSEIRETGQLNSYGSTDNVLKPSRYTSYNTYQATVDRIV